MNALAVVDHNVPTSDRSKGIAEEESRIQVETLATNAADFGVEYYSERDKRQGVVHVIGYSAAHLGRKEQAGSPVVMVAAGEVVEIVQHYKGGGGLGAKGDQIIKFAPV
jgi:homoaconitase/3-isopropylmalate dehydratase large subunit